MDTSEEIPYSLKMERRCQLSEQKCMLCAQLLVELLPTASIPNIHYLQRVIFCDDDAVEPTVNAVMSEQKKFAGSYVAGPTSARAVAVPLELDDGLRCSIVLGKSEVELLEPEHYHPQEFVSSLLEELLHVRIYGTAWEQRGYIQPPPSLSAYERDLLIMCTLMRDEHMVARWKTAIMGSIPLIDVEGGFSFAYPRYGNQVAPMLDRAALSLRKAIQLRFIPYGETQLLRTVYREVFEPLARNAGFQAGTPPTELQYENNPSGSVFFQEHVVTFWNRVKEQLERSFDSSLAEMDNAVDEIVKIVGEFIGHIEEIYH